MAVEGTDAIRLPTGADEEERKDDGGSDQRVRVMRYKIRLNNEIGGPCYVCTYEITNETIVTERPGDLYRRGTAIVGNGTR